MYPCITNIQYTYNILLYYIYIVLSTYIVLSYLYNLFTYIIYTQFKGFICSTSVTKSKFKRFHKRS